MVERKRINRTTYLISHPKAGRTWIRVMMGRVLYLSKSTQMIKYIHDGMDDISTERTSYKSLNTDKKSFSRHNVILLVRDPRDLIVSYYFEVTKREKVNYWSNMSEFIRDDCFGIRSVISFYNIWCNSRDVPHRLLLVRYEDMQKDCHLELKRILSFVKLRARRRWIRNALQCGSFDSMRKMEISRTMHGYVGISSRCVALKPGDIHDLESYKTRKGKVGGYKDYFSESDLLFCNEQMQELNRWFMYEI